MAGSESTSVSGILEIDALLTVDQDDSNIAYRWDTTSLSYSFPESGWPYVSEQFFDIANATQLAGFAASSIFLGPIGALLVFADDFVISTVALNGFQEFTAEAKASARFAMEQYDAVSGLTLNEQGESFFSHADVRFGETGTTEAPAFGIPPLGRVELLLGEGVLGDTWYVNDGRFDNPVPGTYADWTILHEAGHAMGLKHSHEQGLFGGRIPESLETFLTDVRGPVLGSSLDTLEFTVMTYTGNPTTFSHPQTLMMLDIQAIQYLYGANFDHNSGDTTYTWDSSTGTMSINGAAQRTPGENRVFMTIWDGNGNDTYDLSNYLTEVKVNLLPGEWTTTSASQLASIDGRPVRGNVANALLHEEDTRSLIENAIGGSDDDTLSGNEADNLLKGNDGNDIQNGLSGNDTLLGNAGNDTLDGGEDNDSLDGGDGNDSVDAGAGADTVSGGDGDDTVSGGSGDDTIDGGGGKDTVDGGAGNDSVDGGTGNDSLASGTGNDTVFGGMGEDFLTGGDGNDRIEGQQDNDVIDGGDGDDTLSGGRGNDRISGFAGADLISGGAANDVLEGGSGNDTINDGEGDNNINGGSGDDSIITGAGLDTINGELGKDFIDSGDGSDSVNAGVEDDTVRAGGGNDIVLAGMGDDNVSADTGNDTVEGNDGNDTLNGDAGEDVINGGDGDDEIHGGNDNDTIYGGLGSDVLFGEGGIDLLFGNEGNDTLSGGGGADTLDGGAGVDTASFTDATGPVVINQQDPSKNMGDSLDDRWISIEQFGLSNFDDRYIGFDAIDPPDSVFGGDGNDTVLGFAGDDTLFGENGDDFIVGGEGADEINGGAGFDRTSFQESTTGIVIDLTDQTRDSGIATGDLITQIEGFEMTEANDEFVGLIADESIFGFNGNDTLSGNGGNDTIYGGTQHDSLFGGAGNDKLFGEDGLDLLSGGADNDLLEGGEGQDELSGGDGNDTLWGGIGNDLLRGGLGGDMLSGGVGFDNFIYHVSGWGVDTVTGFEDKMDKIVIEGFGTPLGRPAMNNLNIYDNMGDTVIELASGGSDKIILVDFDMNELGHQDFMFV